VRSAHLERVDERDPGQISEGEHESETVSGDVHGGEDRSLGTQSVPHIEALEGVEEEHREGDRARGLVLLVRHPYRNSAVED
jgi:hypothetical protein